MHKRLMSPFMPVTCLISTGSAAAGSIVQWRSDDSAGTAAVTSSGNGRRGTPVSTPTFVLP